MLKQLVLFFSFFFIVSLSFAQRQTFKAGAAGGINLSQLDGDTEVGFNKVGVQFGVKGIAKITNNLHVNIELLFNQKGAAFSTNPLQDGNNFRINYNFMEVPVLLDLLLVKADDDHYKHHLTAGIGYGRLIGTTYKEDASVSFSFKQFEDDLNKNEISPIFGYSYYFTPNIFLDLRYSFAISRVYDRGGEPPSNDIIKVLFLRNYYISGRVGYVF